MDAYNSDASTLSKKKPHGEKFRSLILSDELRPKNQKMTTSLNLQHNEKFLMPNPLAFKKTHQRSQSDASALLPGIRNSVTPNSSSNNNKLSLGDLTSGKAFENGCMCFDSCQGVVNDLRGQKTECSCSVSIKLRVASSIQLQLLHYCTISRLSSS